MPYMNGIRNSLDNFPSKDQNEIIRFWNEFYYYLEHNTKKDNSFKVQYEEEKDKSLKVQYKDEVINMLINKKASLPLSDEELRKMQMEIEDLTMVFDDKSMFKTAPNIIKILIRNNEESAKDYLRGRANEKVDIELLSEFDQYTLEALIVHVLSIVFHTYENNSIIRVASLVEQLELNVRRQASLLKSRRYKKPLSMDDAFQVKRSGKENLKKSKLVMMFPFGTGLVQFMEERGLISFVTDLSGSVRVIKKKGAYFLPSKLYAVCNFDISLLPIKLNLPMVCKPLDWTSTCPPDQKPRNLSELSGGYLSCPTGEIYDRYRLLSSGNINHFYIDIGKEDNYMKLCNVMNKLQSQAFQINSNWLNFIQNKFLFVFI